MSSIGPTTGVYPSSNTLFGVDVTLTMGGAAGPTTMQRPTASQSEPWTVRPMENGQATINLGERYDLLLNEHNSQLQIVNKSNGEITNIWGDPHIDWNKDGVTDADFYTKSTFVLEDGTKITIDTEKYSLDPTQYLSNNVLVTRGDRAIEIKGLSQNAVGDMTITQRDRGGRLLDWQMTDGFVVRENSGGEGWINEATGRMATAQDFQITRPEAEKPYELQQALSQFLQAASPRFQRLVNPGALLEHGSGAHAYGDLIGAPFMGGGMPASQREGLNVGVAIRSGGWPADTRGGRHRQQLDGCTAAGGQPDVERNACVVWLGTGRGPTTASRPVL